MRSFGKIVPLFFLLGFLEAGVVYFPHYGDGGGLSTLFSVSNPSQTPAAVGLYFHDSAGSPQALPFAGGSRSSQVFALPPGATRTFRTTGVSRTVRSGFASLETDNDQVSGVAIFQFDSGAEASVLPIRKTRWRSLFASKGPGFDTGLAILRTSDDQPINYRLYDESGRLIRSGELTFGGLQASGFLGDIFPNLRGDFTGTLLIDSPEAFGMLGLRFGNGLLSTVPSPEFSPRGLALLQRFAEPSGLWFFAYTIGSTTFDNQYAVYQVVDLTKPGETDDFFGLAVDEFSDPVVASHDEGADEIAMLDQGSIIDRLYRFDFESDDEISGCYHQIVKSSGSVSQCYPLVGLRFDGQTLLTQTGSRLRTQTDPEDRESLEFQAVPSFSKPSPELEALIAKLRSRAARGR